MPTAWQVLDDGDPPPSDGVTAYDSMRSVAVRVMPAGGGPSPPTTWELVGEDWKRRFIPEPTPHDVSNACSAFDPDRGVVVVFGGNGSSARVDDTWEYDGSQWVRRQPPSKPPARNHCALAYDTDRHRIVLFGGFTDSSLALQDTWEYDGTNWVEVSTNNKPAARAEAGMAYDVGNRVVVLFGGWQIAPQGVWFGDTWTYDGRNWRQKNTPVAPGGRRGPGMAYDPVRQRTVVFGGATATVALNDTWEWNGRDWVQVVTPQAPAGRWNFRLVYDAQRGKVLGHGGYPDNGKFNDTWVYDGTTWTRVAISGLPHNRKSFAMAYDPQQEAVVLYGGNGPDPDGVDIRKDWSDTWHYANGSWQLQDPQQVGAPSTYGSSFPLAWDPGHSRVVGFSGGSLDPPPQDIHEYAGEPRRWTSTPISTSRPERRTSHGWTYAPGLGGILMFGGGACCVFGSGFLADDTWILDGLAWNELLPLQRPSARRDMAFGYHGGSGRGVLHGGSTNGLETGKQSDTWLFNGQDWQLLTASSPPGARYLHSMVYDSARDRIVLYSDGTPLDGVTWEFDGSLWIARSTPFQPDADRCWNPLAYDSKREVVIFFGGRDCGASLYYNDTWAYGPDPDGDGIVGGLDNCRNVANGNQVNGDGDPAGDACDCAPADATAFAIPAEVTGFALAADKVTLSWNSAAPGAGSATVHDVVRGALNELPVGSGPQETCLAPGISASTTTDTTVPTSGNGFWYLVRGRNVCGAGSYGSQSGGLDRSTTACP